MRKDSDTEFSWRQKAYVKHVRPRVLGNLDATSYSPGVAPTATVVTGVEGANLGATAQRAADAIEQAGGRPVVIDAVALRGVHDRLTPDGQSDVASDVAVWTDQLVKDASRRRLDPVVVVTTASPAKIDGVVNSLHDHGCGVMAIAVQADPATAARTARARALSGEPGDQVGLNMQARSQAALAGVVDRLDRDPRVSHIRVVDEHHRSVFRADPSRHASASHEAAKRLDSHAAGQPSANPFGRRPERSSGRER
ncbi:zeta toxin family protein [Pinirhizobacter soli]|uniref:zeta toxin family protein n=1 Tax=Pinirhizobacter soli TaxID=2786953 RepID=UPI00202A4819|nr:zeta toxin family protein [Pinirhizobacter soli]